MFNCFETVEVPSDTSAVNVLVPAAPGVPVILPVEGFSISPEGVVPVGTDHTYVGFVPVPPVATRVWEYPPCPAVQGSSEVVVILNGGVPVPVTGYKVVVAS